MNNKLHHLTIMITRPSPQGEILCDLVQQKGYAPIFFPGIEIVSLTNSSLFRQEIAALNSLDWLIFISPQAVLQTAALLQAYPFPAHIKVAAVGEGTANALNKAHLPVHTFPLLRWNSEGLLALPDFQHVSKLKIALIKGEGGRKILAEELIKRGAIVSQLIAYRRCLPNVDVAPYLLLLKNKKIDRIICTSNEILQNITRLLANAHSDLYRVPLIVISDKMRYFAKQLGFHTIILAQNASHEAIIEVLS